VQPEGGRVRLARVQRAPGVDQAAAQQLRVQRVVMRSGPDGACTTASTAARGMLGTSGAAGQGSE
jgi:hypothetical protein